MLPPANPSAISSNITLTSSKALNAIKQTSTIIKMVPKTGIAILFTRNSSFQLSHTFLPYPFVVFFESKYKNPTK